MRKIAVMVLVLVVVGVGIENFSHSPAAFLDLLKDVAGVSAVADADLGTTPVVKSFAGFIISTWGFMLINVDLAGVTIPYHYLWDAIMDYLGLLMSIIGNVYELTDALTDLGVSVTVAKGISFGTTFWGAEEIGENLRDYSIDYNEDNQDINKYQAAELDFAKLTEGDN